MITRRCALVIGGLASLATLSCAAPTEPHPDAVRFAALLRAPAWTLGAYRDSAFASQLDDFRLGSGLTQRGVRVARSGTSWTTLWDSVSNFSIHFPEPPAVDFSAEMVVLVANGVTPGHFQYVNIVHVTRQRDTVFVLTRVHENSCGPSTQSDTPIDARVVPRTTELTFLLFERRVDNCLTGSSTAVW